MMPAAAALPAALNIAPLQYAPAWLLAVFAADSQGRALIPQTQAVDFEDDDGLVDLIVQYNKEILHEAVDGVTLVGRIISLIKVPAGTRAQGFIRVWPGARIAPEFHRACRPPPSTRSLVVLTPAARRRRGLLMAEKEARPSRW